MTQAQLLSELKKLDANEITSLLNKLAKTKTQEIEKEYSKRERQALIEYNKNEDIDAYDAAIEELEEWQREQADWTELEGIQL